MPDKDSWWKGEQKPIDKRESENEEKLRKMKEEAFRNSDVIVFNAINLYEKNHKDVTVLIRLIKNLYEQSLKNN